MANIGYIQVTRRCNQKCRFCSNPEMERDISVPAAKKLIDEFIRLKYKGVILTGGEPTLLDELPQIIHYCVSKGLDVRIITNGQRLSDFNLFKFLYDSGLRSIHFSVHTVREELQEFLTCKKDSLKNLFSSIKNAGRLKMTTMINIVINKYNADHLDEIVKTLVKKFPYIKHFIFNNIDPTMNRVSENPDTVAKLTDFELSLYRALSFLRKSGYSFRVERVPLCYMVEFAEFSTETRKIIKGEDRIVNFLDDKGKIVQEKFYHSKTDVCRICTYNSICAGLYEMDTYYSSKELYPLFLDPKPVIRRVLQSE
ncbi:MAG: radical SAM protein [Deltaproteobacteria bacterium]|nr:radical SAM protein [Deltaproteobacteria bacterium]